MKKIVKKNVAGQKRRRTVQTDWSLVSAFIRPFGCVEGFSIGCVLADRHNENAFIFPHARHEDHIVIYYLAPHPQWPGDPWHSQGDTQQHNKIRDALFRFVLNLNMTGLANSRWQQQKFISTVL